MLHRDHLEAADLTRLGISTASTEPDDFVFKKVSDNGSNIKSAWNTVVEGGRALWLSCVDHTLELCTIPFTWVEKRKNVAATIPKGSIAESFGKGRGLVGYLRLSSNAQYDFHKCQKECDLPEEKIDGDVRTRWRSAHAMGDQLVYNKDAVLQMDKNPAYKDAGEAWGKNKLSFTDWDHLEQTTACLYDASDVSQMLEGDLYPTSSLVVPMMYRLMASTATTCDVRFHNRANDELNDPAINPVKVTDANLLEKVRCNF